MSPARLAALATLLTLAAACGGAGPGAAGGSPTTPGGGDPGGGTPPSGTTAPAGPGTPAPAAPYPAPPNGDPSNRFEIGAADGLYVVDPAHGEPSVQGFVVATFRASQTAPADMKVTLNGVDLVPLGTTGIYWQVNPAGPQPPVGSGGSIVLVATGTDAGQVIQRTLVLPCPSDVTVTSTPAFGSAIAAGTVLHLASAADLTVNVGIPPLTAHPTATLSGWDPATWSRLPAGSPTLIPPGPLALDLTAAPTTAPAYLLDLRWPGRWIVDGETGGFCGLAKRWTFAK